MCKIKKEFKKMKSFINNVYINNIEIEGEAHTIKKKKILNVRLKLIVFNIK